VEALLAALGSAINSDKIANAINAFSMAAILSSFIGVGLGVFDFLSDLFNFEDSKMGRTKSWLVTFVPPLLMSLLFPFGFVIAIGYAGAAATVWACLIPAFLARKSRLKEGGNEGFVAPGGNIMIGVLIIFGVLTATFHFMSMFNLLPVLG
ncbi:transposase, partial [Salinivibrio sp. VYel6]|uniref:aromatic amino acid transport family protein n=1 Tax=Salinivibrio sp. VYel6 TaxID=2490493 RepID=UPI002739E5E6